MPIWVGSFDRVYEALAAPGCGRGYGTKRRRWCGGTGFPGGHDTHRPFTNRKKGCTRGRHSNPGTCWAPRSVCGARSAQGPVHLPPTWRVMMRRCHPGQPGQARQRDLRSGSVSCSFSGRRPTASAFVFDVSSSEAASPLPLRRLASPTGPDGGSRRPGWGLPGRGRRHWVMSPPLPGGVGLALPDRRIAPAPAASLSIVLGSPPPFHRLLIDLRGPLCRSSRWSGCRRGGSIPSELVCPNSLNSHPLPPLQVCYRISFGFANSFSLRQGRQGRRSAAAAVRIVRRVRKGGP